KRSDHAREGAIRAAPPEPARTLSGVVAADITRALRIRSTLSRQQLVYKQSVPALFDAVKQKHYTFSDPVLRATSLPVLKT
ncbi:MAG: hypothetical protein ACXV4B_06395, partial [Halobacteriota archaeon]